METKFLPSFARQRVRGASSARKKFLKEEFLPKNLIELESLTEVVAQENVIIEIGSGNGETAVNFAFKNPNIFYIACEVFAEGLLQTAGKVFEKDLTNVRFFKQDARLLLQALPEGAIDQLFLFFPDPWPKKRHHKRRILNDEFLALVSSKLKPNGKLLVATDHALYKEHIVELGAKQSLFSFAETPFPEWWVTTKYQGKALNEGRSATFFVFSK